MPSKVDDTYDIADEPPTSIDPYEVLSLSKDASDEDVKKAYRKAALKNHPDKVAEDDKTSANEAFQRVAFAYAILSDPRRRKRYDTTGSTAETLDFEDEDLDWHAFFRQQFEDVITEDTIAAFTDEFQGSEEERQAVLKRYDQGKGSMDVIYQSVMCCNVLNDDDRFRKIIDDAIASGEVEAYDRYTKETKRSKDARIKNAQRQAKEAEAEFKKIKEKKAKKGSDGDEQSLAALIGQRQKERGAQLFDRLEEKYAPKSKGKKRGRVHMEEPPEEAFAATAERMKKSRK